tara:strand:+ start:56 stop:781 length:726 start_codon:yes stop_codon:yes gene_type:complete
MLKLPKVQLNLWMTVTALPVFLVLIGLGTWQLERLKWKEKIISERMQRFSAPILSIGDIQKQQLPNFEFRRIRVGGRYLHAREMLVVNKVWRGQPGFHLITPFKTNVGGSLLVNRGWVPMDWPEKYSAKAQSEATLELTGNIRLDSRNNLWIPDNEPNKNVWFFVDVEQMAAQADLKDYHPYLIELRSNKKSVGYPKAQLSRLNVRNKHFEYALTWYALAVTLFIIFVAFHIRKREYKHSD